MDRTDIVILVCFVIALAIFVWEMVYFAQMKKGVYCEYNGHKIEFKLGWGKALLFVDGQQVDKQRTAFKWVVVLKTQIEESNVEFRMTSGIFKPVMKLFINGEEHPLQKNEKVKKAKLEE